MKNYLTAPTINTNRLYIRIVDLADYNDYFEFCSSENVCRYLTFNPYKNVSQCKNAINNMIRAYLQGTDVNFSFINKLNNRVIGSISLTFNDDESVTLGYILNEKYWNQGLMKEAINAICKVAFEYYEAKKVKAKYISDNIASERVLVANGFEKTNILKNGFIKNGYYFDLIICEKIK